MPRLRPTLRSLAAEAGVSAMAVSLALRNSPEISAQLGDRLRALARLRCYRPDPAIAKLMHHLRATGPARRRANICGLCLRRRLPSSNAINFMTRLAGALKGRAEALGFAFGAIELDPDLASASLQRILLSRGVEGLVLMPMARQCDLSHRLEWEKFSVVSVTSSVTAPVFHSVVPNQFDNMLRVCRELSLSGHRRIGLAIPREWDERVKHRWAGGMAWHKEFGGAAPISTFLGESSGPALTDARFVSWVRRYRPDAIVVEAIDPLLVAKALGGASDRRRPKIVTLNWPNAAAECGIDQRVEEIGSVAIDLLSGLIARGERGVPLRPNTTMVTGDWKPA